MGKNNGNIGKGSYNPNAHTASQDNHHSNQGNPNNAAHRANNNNHANQCNPNNAAYHSSRGGEK